MKPLGPCADARDVSAQPVKTAVQKVSARCIQGDDDLPRIWPDERVSQEGQCPGNEGDSRTTPVPDRIGWYRTDQHVAKSCRRITRWRTQHHQAEQVQVIADRGGCTLDREHEGSGEIRHQHQHQHGHQHQHQHQHQPVQVARASLMTVGADCHSAQGGEAFPAALYASAQPPQARRQENKILIWRLILRLREKCFSVLAGFPS